jgi:hypothetical protein
LITDSIENLYLTILNSLENGYKPTKATAENAKNLSIEAGSVHALKMLYPWHPSFQKMDEQNSTEMLAIDFQYEAAGDLNNRNSQTQKLSPIRHGPVATGGESLPPPPPLLISTVCLVYVSRDRMDSCLSAS